MQWPGSARRPALPGSANQREEWGPSPPVTGGAGWGGAVAQAQVLLGSVAWTTPVQCADCCESVLLPCASPQAAFSAVWPARLHDAGGPRQVVRAFEPAGSGWAAAAPAAGQIRRGGGRRTGQSADTHSGTEGGRGAAAGGWEALRSAGGRPSGSGEDVPASSAPDPPREGSRCAQAAGLPTAPSPSTAPGTWHVAGGARPGEEIDILLGFRGAGRGGGLEMAQIAGQARRGGLPPEVVGSGPSRPQSVCSRPEF